VKTNVDQYIRAKCWLGFVSCACIFVLFGSIWFPVRLWICIRIVHVKKHS